MMSSPSKGSKKSTKSGKGSYSYSMSYSKSGKSSSPKSGKGSKGGKGFSFSHSMSMSYPPNCRDDGLTFKACVIYIVDMENGTYQLQSIDGGILGEHGTEQEAIDEVTNDRKYVQATDGEQEQYSSCHTGPGVLVTDPVYFPAGQSDCGDLNYL